MASKRGLVAREDGSLAAIGARPQSRAYSGVEALAAGLLRRRRPPREPRLVFFFGFGASSPTPFSPAPFSDGALSEGALSAVTAGSGSSGSASRPRSGSGTWILGPSPSPSPSPSAVAVAVSAGFFLRRLPPREPRRV